MKYILNPNPIFEDFVIKKDIVSNKNKHTIINFNINYSTNNKKEAYYDHIETSGFYSSLIYSYGANEKKEFKESYHLVFPTFRRKINDTRGSFSCRINNPIDILINNKIYKEKLKNVQLNGFINVTTSLNSISINKHIYCANFEGVICNYNIINPTNKTIKVNINLNNNFIHCDDLDYFDKPYHIELSLFKKSFKNNIEVLIKPNNNYSFALVFSCLYDDTTIKNKTKLLKESLFNRIKFLSNIDNSYKVITNNNILDTMHKFSKIRASESIFLTKNGYMHCPGGGNYYAATWNNDQCEYASIFFSYLPYDIGRKTMINCFKQYEKYMYGDIALVSSIIAQGDSYWNGAKDRGDGAMYVYGLTRFLLTIGDKKLARQFINPIKWCIDYSLNKKNKYNVIESDSDELENRFESGNCNISTNAIFYQALIKANLLFNELNIKNNYDVEAKNLKDAINKYFYKNNECIYCIEETHKRSHVVYPLIMGIYEHKDDIVNHLMNNNLYSDNGFKTIDNCQTYWDRVTLMAIRGLFNANEANLAYDILLKYSNVRLLNDHVPYAIEAYPEGNQAHLAAESALYARIYLEGILGFEPESFSSFKLKISMPDKLKQIKIENIYYAKKIFTIHLRKCKDKYLLTIEKLNYKKLIENFKEVIINIK